MAERGGKVKLFVVTHYRGWSTSWNVVRALDKERAAAMFDEKDPKRLDIEELAEGNWPGILWTHEESPDSPRGED